MAIANIDWQYFLDNMKFPKEYEEIYPDTLKGVVKTWEKNPTEVKKAFGFLYPNVVNHAHGTELVKPFTKALEVMNLSDKSDEELSKIAIGIFLDEEEMVKEDVHLTYYLNEVIDDEDHLIDRNFYQK